VLFLLLALIPQEAAELKDLQARYATLKDAEDGEIFAKGAAWALEYDPLQPSDLALVRKALERGRSRAAAIADGKRPWDAKKGKLVAGFRSAIDGSVQPFGLVVPASYDPARPIRLDVVLHGSTRPVGMSELRFMNRFDEGDEGGKAPEAEFIELHPLGRVENGYRWAGETDVYEAIEAVARRWSIDRARIVLRGMSMGASGTWHLGLKRPDRWVALGPYCGYVDTRRFSETPMPNFVKVGELPLHQDRTLHLLDSIDYAANAGVVPAVACMGEKDPFFQAHVLMGEAMKREGLEMVNLIAPNTAHVIDPATQKEQLRRIAEHAARGLQPPRQIRFVTWTLKYGRCHWLDVLGLNEHYARAEISARIVDDGTVEITETKNVARFSVRTPGLRTIRIGGSEIAASSETVVARRGETWAAVPGPLDGKRPGLQGPIDDAFTGPFLCVRGTGRPWNPAVQAWADASLRRFAREWRRYFRGDLPVKDDAEVTVDDARRCHLILFGDPSSNAWIAKVMPKLPIVWTKEELRLGGVSVAADTHAPALIQPNPLAPGRYVVLNSGHTFREKELSTLNYLLFPRLGDWGVIKVAEDPAEETVVRSGFFGERWEARD
jgi:pimeloyl-ACP methyl ester carboxylesterase